MIPEDHHRELLQRTADAHHPHEGVDRITNRARRLHRARRAALTAVMLILASVVGITVSKHAHGGHSQQVIRSTPAPGSSPATVGRAAPAVIISRNGQTGVIYQLDVGPTPSALGACPPTYMSLAMDRDTSKPSVNVNSSTTFASGVLVPGADQVVVAHTGAVGSWESYTIVRVGSDVTRVAALSGPNQTLDAAQPDQGWAILDINGISLDDTALRATLRSGSTFQFFLRDAAPGCTPSPKTPGTPYCQPGQYSLTVQATPGAGTLAADADLSPVGVSTCGLRAASTAAFRYATGQPDGTASNVSVNWILPATLFWPAGSDCFARTETLTVTVGSVTRSETFPASDCTVSVQGENASLSHALGPYTINGN